MSYVKRRSLRRTAPTLGATVESYLQRGESVLAAAKQILDDPALPQVTGIVMDLHKLEQKPGQPTTPGIGLKRVVKPFMFYYYTRKNSWVLPVVAIALIGIPFFLGFQVGKRRKT